MDIKIDLHPNLQLSGLNSLAHVSADKIEVLADHFFRLLRSAFTLSLYLYVFCAIVERYCQY